jgi:hypothetical protein
MINVKAELEHYWLVTDGASWTVIERRPSKNYPLGTVRGPASLSMNRGLQRSSPRGGVIPSQPHAVCWRMSPRNGVTCSNISDRRPIDRQSGECRINVRRCIL